MLILPFTKYKALLAEEIHFLQGAYSVINTYSELMTEGISSMEAEISIAEMPARQIILGDRNGYTGEKEFIKAFVRFCSDIHEPKLNLSFPVGGYWEDMSMFLENSSLPKRFFPSAPKAPIKRHPGST
jgi:hypothetical protein